jgi:hypothetical protein
LFPFSFLLQADSETKRENSSVFTNGRELQRVRNCCKIEEDRDKAREFYKT